MPHLPLATGSAQSGQVTGLRPKRPTPELAGLHTHIYPTLLTTLNGERRRIN